MFGGLPHNDGGSHFHSFMNRHWFRDLEIQWHIVVFARTDALEAFAWANASSGGEE